MPQRVHQKDRRGIRKQVLHVQENGKNDAAQKVLLLLHAVDGPEKQPCAGKNCEALAPLLGSSGRVQ